MINILEFHECYAIVLIMKFSSANNVYGYIILKRLLLINSTYMHIYISKTLPF